MANRLDGYSKQTIPVLDHYAPNGIVKQVRALVREQNATQRNTRRVYSARMRILAAAALLGTQGTQGTQQ